MRIEHTIKVDFQRPGVRPVVRIVEGDASTRYIVANLYNGGEPFSVGSGVTGVVKYAKSDGHSGVYDTIDKDKATEHAAVVFHDNSKQAVVELAPNISMGFGLVALIVQFVASSGTDILGTFPIDVIVERDPTDGTEAETYFSYKALDELYAAIDEAKADAAEALAAGLHDITAEYITAKASRPTLTPDVFLLEQEDGLYRINDDDGDSPLTARVVTDRAGAVNMDVVEYRQGDRIERTYIDSTLVTTVTMNSGDGAVEINPETLVGDLATAQSNIAALQAENVALKTRVDAQGYELENLIVAGDGKIYSKSVDSSEAYTKIVPANALPYAALDSIGGKSIVLNQIFISTRATASNKGVTSTPVDQYSFTLDGTASGSEYITMNGTSYTVGHVYLCRCNTLSKVRWNGARYNSAETIITVTSITVPAFAPSFDTGDVFDASVIHKPECIDLTKMFGAGNEPQTVEQAYAMGVPRTYIPPNDGEIVSADVQSINASGRTPNPIPQAIRSLPGYGWSTGSVYNEVDYANKQYIKRVGTITLTGSDVNSVDEATTGIRYASFIKNSGQKGNTSNMIDNYGDTATISVPTLPGMIRCFANRFVRYDNAYTDTDVAKALLDAIPLTILYELAEPIITDISNLLPANFAVLAVEDSGTVTFQQANGITLAVPSTITFPVKIGGDEA